MPFRVGSAKEKSHSAYSELKKNAIQSKMGIKIPFPVDSL
jgi:hypothetical protein